MTVTDAAMQITVSHRIPVELAVWIAQKAESLGISKSEVLRRALDEARKQEATLKEGKAA